MAEKPRIPVDGHTGIPVPVLLVEKPSWARGKLRETFDHMWCPHETLKADDPAGRALRYSIGQDMAWWLHSLKNQNTDMPELPSSEADYFRPAVLACANLIGPYAVDLTKDDWTEQVLMTPEEYAFNTDRQRMHMQDEHHPVRFKFVRDRTGMFFAKHALDHGLQHVSRQLIDQFLSAKDPDERARLANLVLRESVDMAVEPVVPVAQELREMAPVRLEPVDLRGIVHRFFIQERFDAYHDDIAQRLAGLQMA